MNAAISIQFFSMNAMRANPVDTKGKMITDPPRSLAAPLLSLCMSSVLATPAATRSPVVRPAVRPVVLVILDGFGERPPAPDNPIANASMPNWRQLLASTPHTTIDASELRVGLPPGQMGNSEVGHLNIGAGRVVYQDFTRIDHAIATGEFAANPVLTAAVDTARTRQSALHVLGLLSPGGVHSHERQIAAMVELAAARGATRILVHAFLDGRDTPPRSCRAFACVPGVSVRTLSGRPHRVHRRPLLRDGPRPALGSRRRSLRLAGRWQGAVRRRVRVTCPRGRPTRAAKTTNSSRRPRSSIHQASPRRWPTATWSCS
jgi:hypothetical protein